MNQAETALAVQKAQEYIERHMREKITLKQLANAAGYSPWHVVKAFKHHTGRTPFEYIRLLRLTGAALRLRDEKPRILDVALDFVFDSHEGFTRAFTKEFGLSPKAYSKSAPPIQLFMPEKVYSVYLALKKGGSIMSEKMPARTVFVQVVERPARKVLLKRGKKAEHYFEYCEEVGCDVVAAAHQREGSPLRAHRHVAAAAPHQTRHVQIRAGRGAAARLRKRRARGVGAHRAAALQNDDIPGRAV